MKEHCVILAVALGLLVLALSALGGEPMASKNAIRTPEITEDVLLNPGMGLFFMPGLKGDYDKDWYMPIVAVAYFREDWSLLEPEEGKYQFDKVLDPAFAYWLSRGKRVALRVMSSNMHSRQEYVSPKWVFDAGVPGVEHQGLYIPRQIDPPFWNPLYMEKQAAFIRALGKKYNGMKGLEFVDLGPVGEWGESHLMRWSSEDKEKTGYTPTVYTKAYMRFLDLYCEAFPNTPLALNCWCGAGQNDVVVDYAVSKGVWLRQDGLVPEYSRKGPSAYYHQYFSRVKTLYELCHGYKDMAERGMTALATFKRGLEDPISYLNLMGVWEMKVLSEEDREACRHAARYVGYRLAPVTIEHPEAIRLDPNLPPRFWLKVTWRNLGAAPCYQHLAVEIALASEKGEDVFRMVEIPEKPTTLWLPKQDVVTYFSSALPKGLAPGTYSLKIGLVDPFDETRHILLPLKNRDARGRYPVSLLPAEPRTAPLPQPKIAGGDFEADKLPEGWWFAKGLQASLVKEDAPEGKQCLRLEGKTGEGWNYGGAPGIPLLPGAEYLLKAKMKVIALDDTKKPPHFKMGLEDSEKKWFANMNTGRYDVSKMGTWQELRGQFVTPANTAGGRFAIEKGDTLPREVVILVDDVRLQLLGAP